MPPDFAAREGYIGQARRQPPPGKSETNRFRGSEAGIVPSSPVLVTRYETRLPPYGQHRWVFKIPHVPAGLEDTSRIARLKYDDEKAKAIRLWQEVLNRSAIFEVPDDKLMGLEQASIANLFLGLDRQGKWLVPRVNELQYDGFYLRDGAFIIRALDLMGYDAEAEECLRYFLSRQKPDGLFQSQAGQMDGWGQALWAIGQHARITGDAAFQRRALPSVAKAVAWMEKARQRPGSLGLLPPADPRDNEQTGGHLFGAEFFAYRGLLEAYRLAQILGDPRAERWDRDLAAYHASLMSALKTATARTGGFIPPALEPGGYDWGNLESVVPGEVLPPQHPWVTATLNHARTQFTEGQMTYADRDTIHGYLGFDVPMTELQRGEKARVMDALLSAAAHTTAANGGFEYGSARRRDYGKNLAPHGCWAAKYLALLRDCLVREDGDTLHLGGALSPDWVKPGQRVRVVHAPTDFGAVSYALEGRDGGARLDLQILPRNGLAPLKRVVLHAPIGTRFQAAEARHGLLFQNSERIELSPDADGVEIVWGAPRDAQKWTTETYLKRYCLPAVVKQ
jgi:hypothetical protein